MTVDDLIPAFAIQLENLAFLPTDDLHYIVQDGEELRIKAAPANLHLLAETLAGYRFSHFAREPSGLPVFIKFDDWAITSTRK